MPYLKINGYPVKTRAGGEVSYDEIAGHRQHSFNGLYQFSRNALARRWQFTTIPLPKSEALALAGMINMQGEAWRWSLGSTAPNGVHYLVDDTSSIAWTDKRRTSQNLETKATLVSAFGADGARVYDWNGNAYAPFSGCDGAVLVEPGTTNLLSTNEAHPTANGHVINRNGATHAADTTRYWTGSGCIAVNCTATDDGIEVNGTGVVSSDYVLTCYVRGHAGSEAVKVRHVNAAGATIATQTYTLPAATDTWTRLRVAGTQVTDTTVRLFLLSNGGAMDFSVDGLQIEQKTTYPTAWVSPGSDPWGSGNGIRPAGVLDYDTFLSSYTKGITVSAWVNYQKLSPAANQVIFEGGDNNPRIALQITTANLPQILVNASDGSQLIASGSALTAGIKHIVGTYDPVDKTTRIYINGALGGSDATWSGARQKWDPSTIAGDFSIGSAGTAGTNTCPGPVGPVQVFPFAAPLNFIAGLYNSGGDQTIVPGLMPLGVSGTALGAGETEVACYGQVNAVTNVPHYSDVSGAWEEGGATVTFTLVEATGR